MLRSAAFFMTKEKISCSSHRAAALREVPNFNGGGRIPLATMSSVAERLNPNISQTVSMGMRRIGNSPLVVFQEAGAFSGDRAQLSVEGSYLSSWSRLSVKFLLPMIATWNALI